MLAKGTRLGLLVKSAARAVVIGGGLSLNHGSPQPRV